MENDACPSECQCSTYAVKCIGKDLKTIPKGIPLAVRQIDLSNNPSIQIPRDYFLRFKHLFILSLNNCSQKGPIYLPKTIRGVRLGSNAFNVNTLREMFSDEIKLLRRVDLADNGLQTFDVKEILKLLPPTIEEINISNNNIKTLNTSDFRRFRSIKTINIQSNQLKSIEAHTFDKLSQLTRVLLNGNNLCSIPENIFSRNLNLSHLYISANKLTMFNATKLGLHNLMEINLAFNHLTTFDLGYMTPTKLWLNGNRIQKVNHQIFKKKAVARLIALNDNMIESISVDAFKNVNSIKYLSLHNNNLNSLPRGVFKGITVTKIMLRKNNLSMLTGVFDGIKPFLTRLDLSGNKHLRIINGTDLASIPAMTEIYLTCRDFKQLTDLSTLRAKIYCRPNVNKPIATTNGDGLGCRGYTCSYSHSRFTYICTACRQGYYTNCSLSDSCIACPPGSYYQDQEASMSCHDCRKGQFVPPERSPGKSALDCQTCPQGTNTTVLAGTRACKCLHGYSRRYRFGPCHKCNHNGFDCIKHDYQTLRNGFWMTWKGTQPEFITNNSTPYSHNQNKTICQHMYNQFITNLDIKDDNYKRATMQFKCHMPLPIKCPMFDSCLGGIHPTCSRGYNGVLCAVCDRGYSLQFNKCIQCPQPLWASLQFIGYIALFVIFCFIMSLTDQIIIDDSQKCLQRNRTLADIILSSLKILIGFYQIFISIMHAFSNIHWPHNLKTATNILQYAQFQIIKLPSLRCIQPHWNINAIDEFWIMFIIIITIPFLSLLYYFIKSIYIHFQYSAPHAAKHKRYKCAKNCIKYVALFLFVTYPLISTKTIQILPISCHSFCTAKQNDNCINSMSFLRSDYSIPCHTMADHKATLITGYTCLLIPFGLPIILVMLLWSYAPTQRRSTGQPITDMMESNYDDEDTDNLCDCPVAKINDDDIGNLSAYSTVPVITSALKFSYENYHVRYWYWEVIEMIRTLLMTIGIGLFLGHTKIGLTCTLIVAMIFTVLHAIIKPLKNNVENGAQFISLVLVPLNLAYGAVLQSQDTQDASIISKEKDSYYEGIFLVIINSTLIIIVIVRIIVVIGMKVRTRVKNLY